jgi:hypothetical protein
LPVDQGFQLQSSGGEMNRVVRITCAVAAWAVIVERTPAATVIDAPSNGTARAQEQLGQTFTVPVSDHLLANFEFYGTVLGTGSGQQGLFTLATWTGTAPGVTVFSQSFTSANTYAPLIEQIGNLDLVAGNKYVAYLSPSAPVPVNALVHFGSGFGSDYTGGDLVWFQSGFPWRTDTTFDLAFRAEFVPEPCTSWTSACLIALLASTRARNERIRYQAE